MIKMSIQVQNKSEVKLSVLTSSKWFIVFTFCVAAILLLFSKYHFSLHIGAQENSLLAALFLFGAVISFIRLLGSVIKTCWVLFWSQGAEAEDKKLKIERIVSALLLASTGLFFIQLAIKEILTGHMLITLSRYATRVPGTTSSTDFWFSVVILIAIGIFLCAIPTYGYFKLRKSAPHNDSA